MKEIIPDLLRWRHDGKAIALATILETRGSALRPAGTRMAITADGEIAGSVSSGCVDGDVVAEMEAVLNGKAALRRPQFGISDEQAWSAGLSCGGALELLVELWPSLYDVLIEEVQARRPVGFASRTDKPRHLLHTADGKTSGSLGEPDLDGAVLMDIAAAWPGPHAQKHTYPQGEVFVEVIPPPLTLVVFGATAIAAPLAALARHLDFTVVVNDARRAFLRPESFPEAEVRFGWPQEVFTPESFDASCAVVVLFHDAKFDIPALTLALKSRAFYIGFLGSRATQSARRADLLANGFKESELARIHGPVGLDIGGKEASLIALSILSEIVAVRHRRSGGMLSGAK
ncbi:MAG TPA: XdhC family protein [Anaerolineae bacterium]|nr:XdhC family protein [Anaerolineae bacterium]